MNWQLLIEQTQEGFLLLDEDGIIRYANAAVTGMTGFDAAELKGKHLAFLFPTEEDLIKAEYELGLARKERKLVTEGWRRTSDGSQIWAQTTYSFLDETPDSERRFTILFSDHTEKKMSEVELRNSEEKYRLMVEGVRDYAIFLLDTEGYIQTWNDGARRTKGHSANEIIGKHFSTFYTSEDLESKKPEMELRTAIATGKYEEEGWRVKKNGSVFWANVVITALFNEQNKHIGFSKVTRDLTERRETEEHLRQSEERFRSLVEQVTDYGIFMMDEKGRVISWNEGAKKITGYTGDEIIGKYFSIFYPEEDILLGKPKFELKKARAEGKYEEEGWRIRKNGTRFWSSVVITAVYNTDSTLIGFSKVTRDLTERKASERALRESYDRYRLLAAELQEANTELQEANKELEQFTSIVSHDLQEPVRTIKSFLQLIDMKVDAGECNSLKPFILKSIQSANRMKELIQNLLHYAQLSKEDLVADEVNVQEIINQALQNLRSSIEQSGAVITIDKEVDMVRGDRIQLTQLIQNLLSNALKFTERTSPQIIVSVRKKKEEVQFSISDNGIGIAQQDLHKVFEIFRRLDTRREYPGTGIGLSICKKIVDRHKGRIWPESEPGKGTTFHFTINEAKLTPQEAV